MFELLNITLSQNFRAIYLKDWAHLNMSMSVLVRQ